MYFSDIKAEIKNDLTEGSYNDFLASYVVGMLEYEDIPVDKFALHYMDELMLLNEKAALYFSSAFSRWVVGRVQFTGDPLDEYGLLPDATVFDRAGHSEVFPDWKNNEKCFIFFNNRSHTRDINIERYADLMAKIDISINSNIINSRMFPIALAKDSKIAEQLREAIAACDEGYTKVITSKLDISDLLADGDKEPVTVINITDVNASDKIQYLNHAHDDLLRRFLAIYGININGTGKMAQQSRDEINGSNNAALVVPYEMIKSRMDTIERFNAVTGANASVRLSECWEREEAQTDAEARKDVAEADAAEATAEAAEEAPEEGAPEEGAPAGEDEQEANT